MGKKRDRLEIIRDILQVIRDRSGKIKPTHILYKSNLSHQMMEEYLQDLMQKEFIVEHIIKTKKRESKTYSITNKGLRFLDKYRMIADFTESFGLD